MNCCKNFKTGQKVRVNIPGNAYHGRVFTTGNEYTGNPHAWYMIGDGIAANSIMFYDSQLEPYELDREYINKKIDEIKDEQELLNKKIDMHSKYLAYLDETGQDTVDETEFKAYYAIKVLEQDNMSTVERAKAIADLVNLTK